MSDASDFEFNLFDDLVAAVPASVTESIEQEQQQSVQPVEVFNSDWTSGSESAPMTAADPFYSDPRIVALFEQIAQQQRIIDGLQDLRPSALDAKKVAVSARTEFLESVNATLAQHNDNVRAADSALRSLDQKHRELQDSVKLSLAMIEDLRAKRAVEEAASALERAWNDEMAAWNYGWVDKIKPYQLTALRYTTDAFRSDLHGFGIFDQPGIGKTLEGIASCDVIQGSEEYEGLIKQRTPTLNTLKPESKAILWLCPSSAKKSTMNELQKWGRTATIYLEGNPTERENVVKLAHEFGLVLVASYEQVRNRGDRPTTPMLLEKEWPIVVMDEAHSFKNDESSTFYNIEKIVSNAAFVIPMTGTPILNKPDEFWAILHMLTMKGKYRGKFAFKRNFRSRYCDTYAGKTTFYPGAQDTLVREVSDMVIRRRKVDVLKDLPPKTREPREVRRTPEQEKLYSMMREQFALALEEGSDARIAAQNPLSLLLYLRMINICPSSVKVKMADGTDKHLECSEPGAKLEEALDIIMELLENDEKVLVFSNFNDPLKKLNEMITERVAKEDTLFRGRVPQTGLYTGDTAEYRRDYLRDTFITPGTPGADCAVLLANRGAGGVGLNLQGDCSYMIFLDLFWNDGMNEQAEDRLHRQGQTNAVTIYNITCEDSVDLFIQSLIDSKSAMIDGVVNRAELRKALDDGLI